MNWQRGLWRGWAAASVAWTLYWLLRYQSWGLWLYELTDGQVRMGAWLPPSDNPDGSYNGLYTHDLFFALIAGPLFGAALVAGAIWIANGLKPTNSN